MGSPVTWLEWTEIGLEIALVPCVSRSDCENIVLLINYINADYILVSVQVLACFVAFLAKPELSQANAIDTQQQIHVAIIEQC